MEALIGGIVSHEPWISRLLLNGAHHCSSFFLTQQLLLTAAHCFSTSTNTTQFSVVFQTRSPAQPIPAIAVDSIQVHPNFNPVSLINDLAIIRVRGGILFDHGILFDSTGAYTHVGNPTQITSFTRYASGYTQATIYNQSVISTQSCSQYFGASGMSISAAHVFCVNDDVTARERTGTCRGDSGSPVYFINGVRRVVVGLVSFGLPVCGNGDPTVVAGFAQGWDWIEQVVQSSGDQLAGAWNGSLDGSIVQSGNSGAIDNTEAQDSTSDGCAKKCGILAFLLIILIL